MNWFQIMKPKEQKTAPPILGADFGRVPGFFLLHRTSPDFLFGPLRPKGQDALLAQEVGNASGKPKAFGASRPSDSDSWAPSRSQETGNHFFGAQ